MRCLLVGERILSSLRKGDDVVNDEGHWVGVRERIVHRLPAYPTRGLGSPDACSVSVSLGAIAWDVPHAHPLRYATADTVAWPALMRAVVVTVTTQPVVVLDLRVAPVLPSSPATAVLI